MRPLLAALIVLALHAEARPCSRVHTPFEDAAFAVAVADTTVLVEVVAVADEVATVKVVTVAAGAPLAPERLFRIAHVRAPSDVPLHLCDAKTMEPGRRYLVLAWDPKQSDVLVPVDVFDGIHSEDDDALRSALRDPARASPWRTNHGLAVRLVHRWEKNDETNLMVVVRNTGTRPLTFEHRAWPEAQQSRCTLRVVGPRGPVAPLRVPADPSALAVYYRDHPGASYRLRLLPGEVRFIALPQIDVPVDRKEALGFRYWPLETARGNDYTVSAVCERFVVGATPLVTGDVHVIMR